MCRGQNQGQDREEGSSSVFRTQGAKDSAGTELSLVVTEAAGRPLCFKNI